MSKGITYRLVTYKNPLLLVMGEDGNVVAQFVPEVRDIPGSEAKQSFGVFLTDDANLVKYIVSRCKSAEVKIQKIKSSSSRADIDEESEE